MVCFQAFSHKDTIQNTHLLDRRVFNSVGAVMIVDNLKVMDHLSLAGSGELSIKLCFARCLRVHSKVSGFVQLNTFHENIRDYYLLYLEDHILISCVCKWNAVDWCFSTWSYLRLKLKRYVSIPSSAPNEIDTGILLALLTWLHNPARTRAIEPRSIRFNLAGIMRGINLDSDGCHGNGLQNKRVWTDGTVLDKYLHKNMHMIPVTWSANSTMMV